MYILICAYIIAAPFLLITALNHLLSLNISYSFSTWLAAFVILALFTFHINTDKKN